MHNFKTLDLIPSCMANLAGRPAAGISRRFLLAACTALAGIPGTAGASGDVSAIVDGDTLDLADGRRVRLAGIEAVKLGRFGEAARAHLTALIGGRPLALEPGEGLFTDRHGRVVAQVRAADGRYLQDGLLAAGMARVRTRPETAMRAAEMLAHESAARIQGLGAWSLRVWRVLSPEETARHRDGFHLVEGAIVTASRARARAFLNFGSDWRRDFTAMGEARWISRLVAGGVDGLAGRRARVRGWIELRDEDRKSVV
jgi:endonuclease YncB( thermonuclease family)